jgi:RecB family endonuclease NucS
MDMKPSRFTEEQIIGILREQEAGTKTADVCRKYGISWLTTQCSANQSLLKEQGKIQGNRRLQFRK